MNTVYHNIRAAGRRALRRLFRQNKMRAMSLVHNKRDMTGMHLSGNFPDIRYNAVISRRCDHHATDIFPSRQMVFYLFRRNLTLNIKLLYRLRP